MAQPSGNPISPGIIARVASGVRYAITGKTPTNWFGPGEPLKPVAQETAGRQFDFPLSSNTQTAPRAHEPVSFADLRGLADNCDIVRLAIETRKDQMAKLIWAIQPKDKTILADMPFHLLLNTLVEFHIALMPCEHTDEAGAHFLCLINGRTRLHPVCAEPKDRRPSCLRNARLYLPNIPIWAHRNCVSITPL